ncbi:conserved hypothetical protein, membrane [mine drainage metagenome]|uniref:Uncharacterized protein n=1 Tax=mine drainage metagenome TaxID=410659 RepID=T0ZA04_9ZZZZ
MVNVLNYAVDFYAKHLRLILLFSISFLIAFIIPGLAPLPTYNDAGAIFVRTASIFVNLNIISASIIVASIFFSLLFLSFAIVSINILVKYGRIHTKIRKEIMDGLEKYTASAFTVLVVYAVILYVINIALFQSGMSSSITYAAALILAPFFFYAPSSIVIDEKPIFGAMRASARFFIRRFDYFLLWLAIAILLITIFDFAFIELTGTLISRYAMVVFNSLFILPFLVVLQSEMYMKRFSLLKR